jgi:hypothetical protein
MAEKTSCFKYILGYKVYGIKAYHNISDIGYWIPDAG